MLDSLDSSKLVDAATYVRIDLGSSLLPQEQ